MNYQEYLVELKKLELESLEKLTELQSDCIEYLSDENITLKEELKELNESIQI